MRKMTLALGCLISISAWADQPHAQFLQVVVCSNEHSSFTIHTDIHATEDDRTAFLVTAPNRPIDINDHSMDWPSLMRGSLQQDGLRGTFAARIPPARVGRITVPGYTVELHFEDRADGQGQSFLVTTSVHSSCDGPEPDEGVVCGGPNPTLQTQRLPITCRVPQYASGGAHN